MGDQSNMVKVVELSTVSPPPGSVAESSLPLTFFDVSWLQLPSVQRIFFYEFSDPDTTTSHFLHSLLPKLKHSLSLALQLFYPLCGNLTLSLQTGFPEIHYIDGDFVSFSVVESTADFHRLVSNHPKDLAEFHTLVPNLPNSPALLSLQVTLFPDYGICIGFCLHHAAGDGRSVNHFMKSWASINRTGDVSSIVDRPLYDRDLVKDPTGLKRIFMEQMEEFKLGKNLVEQMAVRKVEKPLRATFVLTRSEIERLKQQVMDKPDPAQKPLRCSTFAVTCGYVWACLIKARGYVEDKTVYFTAPVDCRTRVDPPLPNLYFGNCIIGSVAKALGRDLAGKDGFVIGSKEIGRAVEGLREGVLKGAENSIPYFASLANEYIVSVAGSPRFRVYDTDFGWGRPRKTEVVSIDGTGAIYIGDCRDEEGGIEFGLVLPASEMSLFTLLFEEGLKCD